MKKMRVLTWETALMKPRPLNAKQVARAFDVPLSVLGFREARTGHRHRGTRAYAKAHPNAPLGPSRAASRHVGTARMRCHVHPGMPPHPAHR